MGCACRGGRGAPLSGVSIGIVEPIGGSPPAAGGAPPACGRPPDTGGSGIDCTGEVGAGWSGAGLAGTAA
jgi:hypothetical protein